MATRYLIGTGNWSNDAIWSDVSGGAGGFSHPTEVDDVICDAASGAVTLTVDQYITKCKSTDFTGGGASNFTGTFAINQRFDTYGNVTFSPDMNITCVGTSIYIAGNCTFTSNGKSLSGLTSFVLYDGIFTPADDLNLNSIGLSFRRGLTTNNNTITCGAIETRVDATSTLSLGTSEINCTSLNFSLGSATIDADEATINCSGNFSGGGKTYGIVNLTSTSTISGNNTFSELNLNSATAKTKTLTAGSTQTGKVTAHGSTGKKITINSSTPGSPAYLVDAAGSNNLQYVDLTDIQVSGGADWTYDFNSTYNTGNSGWRANPFEFNFSDFEWNTESVFA